MIYIYHHNDADGYASAATVLTYLKLTNVTAAFNWTNEVKFISYCYEPLDTFVPVKDCSFNSGDSVYIVDLSVSTGTLSKFLAFLSELYNRGCSLTWIDHHKSSVDFSFNDLLTNRFNSYGFNKYIDTNFCAAYNTFSYLLKDTFQMNTPEIIRVIDDYDCWKLKLNGSKEFIVGFSLFDRQLPSNPEWFDWLTDRSSSLSIIKTCIQDGTIISEWLRIDETNKFNSYMFETKLCGLSCCALNLRRNSDIFRTQNNYEVYLSYIYDGNKYTYSIYSRNEDIYCNKIAELFGGGGHPSAAGFSNKHLVVKSKRNPLYFLRDLWRKYKYYKRIKNLKG